VTVSRKLVEGVDAIGDTAWYMVEGSPDVGYDLFLCRLTHVSHHRRSWQAVDAANPKETA
jgi:hypothetical protein